MRTRSLAVLAIAVLTGAAGCASTTAEKPAVCDGKHRRPANPYGSVLPTIPLPDAPTPTVAPGGAQKPPALPGPLSQLDPKTFEPCERPT